MADQKSAIDGPVQHAIDSQSIDWPRALRWYLVVIGIGNLVWEAAHLPLYTIWDAEALREKIVAVVHCTAGDVLIGLASLVFGLMAFASPAWPIRGFARVFVATAVLGIGYTIFSEWLNIVVRASWAYSERMPVVPLIGTGVSPLLQWIVVPALAAYMARRVVLQTSPNASLAATLKVAK